jgi:hypothetical protein
MVTLLFMVKNTTKPSRISMVIMMYNQQTQWSFDFSHLNQYKTTDIHPEAIACGACDDKVYMHVKASEYMIQSNTL